MRAIRTSVVSFSFLISASLPSLAGELAEIAVAGNESAVQSIRNYYGEVELRIGVRAATAPMIWKALYWKTSEGIRIVESRPDRTIDIFRKSDRIETIAHRATPLKKGQVGVRFDLPGQKVTELDAYELSLFVLPVGVTRLQNPFREYTVKEASEKGQVVSERWVELDGEKTVELKIELKDEKRTYIVWLDPKINWLARKVVHLVEAAPDDIWKYEYKCFDFIEVRPTIFAPQRTEFRFSSKDAPLIEDDVFIKSILINSPSLSVPAMPLPEDGAMVLDKVSGTAYQVDKFMRRIGEVNRLADSSNIPVPPRKDVVASSRTWISLSLISVGLILIVVFIARKLRG